MEGYIASRGVQLVWRAPGERKIDPPEIFAIVSGMARYASPALNLSFAGKDAADMATDATLTGVPAGIITKPADGLRVVEAIETLHGDHLGEQIERLAHHAIRGDLGEKAVPYLRQAGLRAARRSALPDSRA